MSDGPGADIHAGFDQLLAATGAYYQRIEEGLAQPDLSDAVRDRLLDARGRATQLVEVLESITYDRVRWLTSLELAP